MSTSICGAWMNAISSNTARAAACGSRRRRRIPSCCTRPRVNHWPCSGRSTFARANWSPCSAPFSMRTHFRPFSTCLRAIAAAVYPRYSSSTMPLITTRPIRVGVHFDWTSCHPTVPSSILSNASGNCCADWQRTTNTSPRWRISSRSFNNRSANFNIPMKPSEAYAAKIKSL